MRIHALIALLALATPAISRAAEDPCDPSGPTSALSPDGQWVANVQQESGPTPWGPAQALTVTIVSTKDPARSQRVYVTAVPRSRNDWPRVCWQGPSAMEVRVSNLLEPSTGSRARRQRRSATADQGNGSKQEYEGIQITVVYRGEKPAEGRSVD